METRALDINGVWEFTPKQWPDDRGVFLEWFKSSVFTDATGRTLDLIQANHSVSTKGTIRGVHFADVPPSQAKYVYCPSGALLDIVVDIRVGSPTFGHYEAVQLDDVKRNALFISEGLGHAFMALTEGASINYLVNEGFNPGREHGINPMDPDLALPWPKDIAALLSPKDTSAPGLHAAAEQGLLPDYQSCLDYYTARRA